MKCLFNVVLVIPILVLTSSAQAATLTLRLDADGLSPGALSTWSDTSGYAGPGNRDVTQATAANQPTVMAGSINGLSAVHFDGNNDFLQNGALGAASFNARTVVSVFRAETGVQETSDLGQIWGAYNDGYHLSIDARAGGNNRGFSYDGNGSTQGSLSLDGGLLTAFAEDSNVQQWTFDSVHLAVAEFNATQAVDEQYLATLAPSFAADVHNFGGALGEILVFDDQLTPDEIAGLQHLLSEKWQTTLIPATPGQIAAAEALFPNGFAEVVPEPASIAIWSLIGLGLAGFGYYRTRRK